MKINDIFKDGLASYPDLLKIEEAAEILNVSESTVKRMLNANELTRLKFKSRVRIPKSEVISLVSASLPEVV
jgi:excisionase family DNA binding protein